LTFLTQAQDLTSPDWNESNPAVFARDWGWSAAGAGCREPWENVLMKRVVVVAGALLLSIGAVVAQQDVVKSTQDQMKATGRALGGTLAPMNKGEKPYDQAAVDAALNTLDDTAKKLPNMFPASIKAVKFEGDYNTSPKIWEDAAGFKAKIEDFAKAVADSKAKIKDLDSLKANFPAIGKACGGCHETFRVKNG
jgi:cytochrome c556